MDKFMFIFAVVLLVFSVFFMGRVHYRKVRLRNSMLTIWNNVSRDPEGLGIELPSVAYWVYFPHLGAIIAVQPKDTTDLKEVRDMVRQDGGMIICRSFFNEIKEWYI